MSVVFPQIDYIMHGTLDKMTFTQRAYVHMLNQNNNFINLTFKDLLDPFSRTYNEKSIIEILELVGKVIDEEESACESRIMIDDIVKNALLSYDSIKRIVNNPSTKLIREEKMLKANKVTHFDSKTMIWLSRRPGVTIQEKVAPKNLIPSKVTRFTMDTAENRHTMYLYDILYDYLYDKIDKLPCANCNKNASCKEVYLKLEELLFLKHRIKKTDLALVKKQKQVIQNNKLLSDKEYKQIWDTVNELNIYEYNCQLIWENLKERFQFLTFLYICSQIYRIPNILVLDNSLRLIDLNGSLSLENKDDANDKNRVIFYQESNKTEISVRLVDERIELKTYIYRANDKVNFKRSLKNTEVLDLKNIFDDLTRLSEDEDRYNSLLEDKASIEEDIRSTQNELDEFLERKPYYSELQSYLDYLAREGE